MAHSARLRCTRFPPEVSELGSDHTPQREHAIDACRAIIHFVLGESNDARLELLRRDYVYRSFALTSAEAAVLDREFVQSTYRDVAALVERYPMTVAKQSFDVAIMTIRSVEWDAVTSVFDVDQSIFDLGPQHQRYFFSSLSRANNRGGLSVVATNIGRDQNVNAGLAVTDLLARFEVGCLFLVGMAAGRERKYELGDVVIPREVYYYEGGTLLPNGFAQRSGHAELKEAMQNNLNYFTPNDEFYGRWFELVRSLDDGSLPSLFVNDARFKVDNKQSIIASGEKVIRNRLIEQLMVHDDRISAGDEESYGFMRACRDKWSAIFRGVSDYGSTNKTSEWQFVATLAAAHTLKMFLRERYEPPPSTDKGA